MLAIEQEYSLKRRPVYKERSAILQRIPQFWCTTLAKHPNVGGMLTEDDIGVLNHCTEVSAAPAQHSLASAAAVDASAGVSEAAEHSRPQATQQERCQAPCPH